MSYDPTMRSPLLSFLLIALLALPASWAAPSLHDEALTHSSSDSLPCESHDENNGELCHCCPDEGGSLASCFSVCAAAVAVPSTGLPTVELARTARPPLHAAPIFTSRADSPFKPPPIL
jgi:hypothetical protein